MSKVFDDLMNQQQSEQEPYTPKNEEWALIRIPRPDNIGERDSKEYAGQKGYGHPKIFYPIPDTDIFFVGDYLKNCKGILEAPSSFIQSYIQIIKDKKIDATKPVYLLFYRRGMKAWFLVFFNEPELAQLLTKKYETEGSTGLNKMFPKSNDMGTITGDITEKLWESLRKDYGACLNRIEQNIVEHSIIEQHNTKQKITTPNKVTNNLTALNQTTKNTIKPNSTAQNEKSDKPKLTLNLLRGRVLSDRFFVGDWLDLGTIEGYLSDFFTAPNCDFINLLKILVKENVIVSDDTSKPFEAQRWMRYDKQASDDVDETIVMLEDIPDVEVIDMSGEFDE